MNEDVFAIVGWWEVRRIPYNLLLALVGFPSFVLFFVFFMVASGGVDSGGDAVEPLALIAAPFLYNICYTAGWVSELALRAIGVRGVGPLLLKLGVGFTLLLLLAPTVSWGLAALVHVLAG